MFTIELQLRKRISKAYGNFPRILMHHQILGLGKCCMFSIFFVKIILDCWFKSSCTYIVMLILHVVICTLYFTFVNIRLLVCKSLSLF